jgi:tellurite resistance protein TehA-like permease
MSPEALVLALSTLIRPTTVAAVFAMLATARPARLLLAYIITGFAFSAGIGVVVLILLSGWTGPDAPEEVRAVIAIVLGAISLGYAAGLLSGHVQQPGPDAE